MPLGKHELDHRLRVLRHHERDHDQHHHQDVDLGPTRPASEGCFKEAKDMSRREQLCEGQFRFSINFLLEAPEPDEALDGSEDVEAEDSGHHPGVADGVEEGSAERKSHHTADVPEETGQGDPE